MTIEALAPHARWVAWRIEDRKGKPTKLPYSPASGLAASSTDPNTWGTREAAQRRADVLLKGKRQGGIGLMLGILASGDVALCGIDLDGCREPKGSIAAWAAEIIERLRSYSEISPSKTGVKIFVLVNKIDFGKLKSLVEETGKQKWMLGSHCGIELYLEKRYFAVTGEAIDSVSLEPVELMIGDPDAVRFVPFGDLKWLIGEAGPALLSGETARESDRHRLDRSSVAYGLARKIRHKGGTIADFRAALARDGRLSGWASEQRDERNVKRAWTNAAAKITEQAGRTEDGIAVHFAQAHDGNLKYDHTAKSWFLWNDDQHRWRKDEARTASYACRQEIRRHFPDDRGFLAHSSINGIEKLSQCDPLLAVTGEVWNRDPWLLGTPGGTVDLRSGALGPGDALDFVTKTTRATPVPLPDFDPERHCPTWIRFLREALNQDEAAIRFFQAWCGYCLTGDTREESLLFVHGPGGSGKSTAVNTIGDILGEYCANVATETLSASKFDRHPEELARLHGSRMARSSETAQGRTWDQQRIKALTGNDKITARLLYHNSFEFQPEFKLTIVGNHQPAIENVDSAMKRRFIVLPFKHIPARPDDMLKKRLEAEWAGILSWAIVGCLDWQKNGLVRPDIVTEATQLYFDTQDTFQLWIDDRCEVGRQFVDSADNLWQSWSHFAQDVKEDTGSKVKTFPEKLQEKGFVSFKNQHRLVGRGFLGLRVREKKDAFDE